MSSNTIQNSPMQRESNRQRFEKGEIFFLPRQMGEFKLIEERNCEYVAQLVGGQWEFAYLLSEVNDDAFVIGVYDSFRGYPFENLQFKAT